MRTPRGELGRWPALGSLALAALIAAGAGGCASTKKRWNVYWENDSFVGTDGSYTNGTEVEYTDSLGAAPKWLQGLGDTRFVRALSVELPEEDQQGGVDTADNPRHSILDTIERRYSVAIGQQMYTPEDLSASTLIEDDRPYAGWLYGSLAIASIRVDHEELRRRDTKSEVKLQLGVVGPAAMGEEVQKWVHDLIGEEEPMGWDNQLSNEPGFVLSARRDYRLLFGKILGWEYDSIGHMSASLGNVLTQMTTGNVIRFGPSVSRDWPGKIVQPEALLLGEGHFDYHFFAGVDGRLVLRDIFLDGNTFKDSHSVDKEPTVADFVAGISARWKNVDLTFSIVARTDEFETEEDNDVFGAFSIRF